MTGSNISPYFNNIGDVKVANGGSSVRVRSRRSMPTAVHAYLFYPGRRQNSPAFKVVVEALKI
jgi:hypothetical protein